MNRFKDRKIYFYSNFIDMRFGIKKAQLLISTNFSPIEISQSIFIFPSKSGKIIKIYYEDEYGYWLLQNKLAFAKFKIPKDDISKQLMNPKLLEFFLKRNGSYRNKK